MDGSSDCHPSMVLASVWGAEHPLKPSQVQGEGVDRDLEVEGEGEM